jgi:hypothetical protein
MLNKLIVASLLALTATTQADTVAPPARPMKLPIAEYWQIDMRSDIADRPTSTITVWTTGAWTLVQRDHGKVTKSLNGTMDVAAFTKLNKVLATATWKSTRQKLRCMAESPEYTVYSYQGKQVMVSRLCDGLDWDQPTREAVARATELTNVFALTGTKPTPPKP